MREMMNLSAEPRAHQGKGAAYQIRRKGSIPGVVYGGKGEPENVQIDERGFGKLYYTGTLMQTIVMLDLSGKKTRVIPREVQVDPVSERPIHVDFMRLEPGARIRIAIPTRFKGQENSPGIKLGGVLNIVQHEVDVYCSADNIPDFIEGDVEGLEIGDSLHISNITLPPGVKTVIQGRDFTIASIKPPTTFVEEVVAAAPVEGAAAEGAVAEGAEGAAAAGAPSGAAAAPAAKGKGAEKGKK